MRPEQRFSITDEMDVEALTDLMAPVATPVPEPPERLRLVHLDTFDWLLWADGLRLQLETHSGRRSLRLEPDGHLPVSAPVDDVPRTADDLPPGYIRDRVAPHLELRALIPQGEVEIERQVIQLRDADGNTVARAVVESHRCHDADGRPDEPPTRLLRLQPLAGHDDVGDALADRLRPRLGDAPPEPLELAAAARGRHPGDYRSRPRVALDPDEPAERALCRLLRDLLGTVEVNVQGVVDDIDTEFLHDLRVAVRRSRSAISELKKILDPAAYAPFVAELRWLGRLTGTLRDLDVNLLDMDGYREALPARARAALGPLETLVAEQRAAEQRTVSRELLSERFRTFAAGWREFLDRRVDAADDAGPSIHQVVGGRILKAHRRLVKKGLRLGDDPPAEPLHRLRIDAKKLRYLLELFAGLYDREMIRELVKELKQVQNILGGFNDMEVQQGRLEDFAGELQRRGGTDAATLMALGRLEAVLEDRQEGYRLSFARIFRDFATEDSRRRYEALCRREARA